MKKILLILISVLQCVAYAYSQGSVKFIGNALCDITGEYGGEITITGYNATASILNLNDIWKPSETKSGTTNVEVTAKQGKKDGLLSTYTTGVKVKLEASNYDGYYFMGFTEQNSITPDSWVSRTTPWDNNNKALGYVEAGFTKKYYAVFKHYVYGHTTGRSAQISEGSNYGEISLSGAAGSWSDEVSESVIDNTSLNKKQKGDADGSEEEYITLAYYAQFKEGYSEENCYFLGWYDGQGNFLSTDFNYSYKFYPTSKDANLPTSVPKIYARFGKKALYKDYATAQVVLQDKEGNYQELSPENEGILFYVGGVYVNSDKDAEPESDDFLPVNSCGTEDIKYITTNSNSGKYNYTYHALAKDDEYVFVGWAEELPNNGEKIIIKTIKNPYTYEHFTASTDEMDPNVPGTLYAVFAKNTFYYYNGAIAGFTSNGEKGRITITSQYYNTATDGEPLKNYWDFTENADIDDSESVYNTALNDGTYRYTYTAEKTNDKTTFKGWSRSLLGGNIISKEASYTEEYITTKTSPGEASSTPALYAVFQSFWYKDPTVVLTTSSAGAGTVAVLYDESEPEEDDWKDEIVASARPNQVPAEDNNYKYSIYYHAANEFGSNFVGWANADDPKQLITDHTQNPYKVDYVVTSTDDTAPFVPAKLYAVFESVIKIIQQDRMIYYVDEHGKKNINDANVLINFTESDIINAELIDNEDLFVISDKANVEQGTSLTLDASTGLAHVVLKYIGEDPANDVGKTATIRLSSQYTEGGKTGTAYVDVKITIETKPTVTFLPTDGKGAYTIKHTDGRGIGYNMPINATENIYVPLSQENMAMFELCLTEDNEQDGLTFSGWEMIDQDGNISAFSHGDICTTYQFKQSVSVRPAFSVDNRAVFTIIGDQYNRSYIDLQEAINVANQRYVEDPNKNLQVVVFSNEGRSDGVLQQGDYVIKQGVMLLIPGVGPDDDVTMNENDEDNYVYRTIHEGKFSPSIDETAQIVLGVEDYVTEGATTDTKAYRKLIVEDNTTLSIQSGASLELYSLLNRNGQDYDARPYRYGHMEMGENCLIDVQDGATLYAFGYITGAHSGQVVAQSGAKVHEVFQYSDPRGGSGVAHLFMCRDYYKVFPFNQYYVQNIEIPLELKSGSVEYITTAADVLAPFVLMTSFVIPDSYSTETSGLFRLGSNTSLIKYYNPITDRLTITVKGDGGKGEFKFGFINIVLGDLSGIVASEAGLGDMDWLIRLFVNELSEVKLDSREYVLPLNNNMDIVAEDVNVYVNSDIAFLAGSTFKIDETSNFEINSGANVYVYDVNQNKLPGVLEDQYGIGYGYYGNENTTLDPIISTPNNSHLLLNGTLKRQSSEIKDSKWVVNGKVIVKSGGGLYTTAGGAQITSTNNGQVTFEKTLKNTETYQSKYIGGGPSALVDVGGALTGNSIRKEGIHNRIAYPVTSAKLLNADGNFQTTSQNTYTYDLAQGKWITIGTPIKIENSEVLVTIPSEPKTVSISSALQGVESAIFSLNGADPVTIPSASIIKDANGVHIPLTYTPSNIAGAYEGILTLNVNQYYQKIIFVEDYTPKFALADSYTFASYLGYSHSIPAGITPEKQNVAGILTGNYKSDWEAVIKGENADEFTFVFGEDANKLSDAIIVFKPKTIGSKTAVLSITCTYTDAAEQEYTTTMAVTLNAIAASLNVNNLAFRDGVEHIFNSDGTTSLFMDETGNGKDISIVPVDNAIVNITSEVIAEKTIWKIAPITTGQVTIIATQEPDLDNGIAGTTIKQTITVTDDIVWNWEHLYFGTTNLNPLSVQSDITINSLEITPSRNYGTLADPIIADGDKHDVVTKLEKVDATYNNKVSIAGWEEGETEVWFTVNYTKAGVPASKEFKSEVYRDPRHLPISVNDTRVYEAVTWAQNDIKYSDSDATVTFTSSAVTGTLAQWTLSFYGIPDLLTFNAQGKGNWQIEESPNGTNWTIAYTWAPISSTAPFELALQPSTRFVRITYGLGDVKGVLSNISISELKSVRADVDKLYMPIVTGGLTKNVVFTYVSESDYELLTSDNGVFKTNPLSLEGCDTDPFYVIKKVGVTSTATDERIGSLSVKGTELSIPIKTFNAPQAIPIQLGSDDLERYYYVTTESYKTNWDENNRAVVMHNAVADAAPYVVFNFADAPVPGVVSFNYSATAKGTWKIQERSTTGTWVDLDVNDAEDLDAQFIMRNFKYPDDSRYLRITYVSDYAEVVELTNLSILPTTNVAVNPSELVVFNTQNEALSITANNLHQITFNLPAGFKLMNEEGDAELDDVALEGLFLGNGTKNATVYVQYTGTAAVTYGELTITTSKDANGDALPGGKEEILAAVKLTGLQKTLPYGITGIKTGVPDGYEIDGFDKDKDYDGADHRDVNTQYAFAGTATAPLFDYVIIYGETTTSDDEKKITSPTSTAGSNAKTPCYIYKKTGNSYELDKANIVENANSSSKSWNGALATTEGSLKVYITGFCPYASTGYSKSDEGVWHFQGAAGDKIDIYLEDCYVYSRYKSKRGNSFSRNNGESYSDKVVRGSGAVLLFANTNAADAQTIPMYVTIHTRGTNLLKSHYGCMFESIVGRAFQVSSPIQIYMNSVAHYTNSYTELDFTDKWPTTVDHADAKMVRTNGFLSLQKQVNNAPSIDMGNAKTVVNFRGGQVELENACNSSDNYESTLAISYRTGVYGPAKFRFTLSHGIGTDGVGGRVNFYDGTTTVQSMKVDERYRQYYLMDEDDPATPKNEGEWTSCLRTPANTFVYGGSHCMMRACPQPTDKGGAPTDGVNPLGLYVYGDDANETMTEPDTYSLVKPTNFPGSLTNGTTTLAELHATYPRGKYGVESVKANDGKLLLWVPAGYVEGVVPEVNTSISYWKACMTYIEAKYGVYEGNIGGVTEIAFDGEVQSEEVYNLLYCQIDQNISEVINGNYSAPVLNPAPADNIADRYLQISPTEVGEELQNYITNNSSYKVESKVYYIVPTIADIWMSFTAPFNVSKIYVMETRDEEKLAEDAQRLLIEDEEITEYRDAMLKAQAVHNADFAAFFGVALALESKKPFEDIFTDYINWANWKDGGPRRNKYKLTQYDGSNWNTADYYLYKNTGDWKLTNGSATGSMKYTTKWDFVPIPEEGGILMEKGETYTMLFPYCIGCFDEDGGRNFWDYWSGKFLIFESTNGGKEGHCIEGSSFVGSTYTGEFDNEWSYTDNGLIATIASNVDATSAVISGNPTFAKMKTTNTNVFGYYTEAQSEGFSLPTSSGREIEPTQSFLYAGAASPKEMISRILRDGTIVTDGSSNGTTGGRIPTVGGGNDLFVTSIAGGINVAVAAPQNVRVLSSTGAVIYSGYIQTAVDIKLPTNGIYIVSGENEVQKILF